jgi:membrane-bound metal-dependent hydrolase YbcI (DUF457 family)
MPLAVTHVLVPMIILDLFRDYVIKEKKVISNKSVLLAGIAGLLPDLDLPLFTALGILGVQVETNIGHRLFFHNIWIPLFFLGFFALLYALNQKKFSKIFLILAFGFSVHVILDATIIGYVMPLFPLSTVEVGLNLSSLIPINAETLMVSLDAVLLLFWLWHEEMEHKIRDYF